MKCISLYQPWAMLLVLGEKKFETRGWRLPGYLIGPRVAIYATKKHSKDLISICASQPFRDALARHNYWGFEDLPLGAIVGSVVLGEPLNTNHLLFPALLETFGEKERAFGEKERAFGDFSPNRWAWPASKPHRLAMPCPWKGTQGIFNVPDMGAELKND